MRPVWMKIKGLNSFLEAQEVDFELLGNQLAGSIRNRLQAFDEQSGDTRNQLHYGAHLDTQT